MLLSDLTLMTFTFAKPNCRMFAHSPRGDPVRIAREQHGNIGEQYGNIEEPKRAQTVPILPIRVRSEPISVEPLAFILNRLAESVSSPEKAGVGGSIPSLATN